MMKQVKEYDDTVRTKSGLMLGMGEQRGELLEALADLREYEVDFLTLGQYLQPGEKYLPVVRYVAARGIRRDRRNRQTDGIHQGGERPVRPQQLSRARHGRNGCIVGFDPNRPLKVASNLLAHPADNRVPGTHALLADESHARVPRRSVSVAEPPPIGDVSQHQGDRRTDGPGQMRDRGIGRHDKVQVFQESPSYP